MYKEGDFLIRTYSSPYSKIKPGSIWKVIYIHGKSIFTGQDMDLNIVDNLVFNFFKPYQPEVNFSIF